MTPLTSLFGPVDLTYSYIHFRPRPFRPFFLTRLRTLRSLPSPFCSILFDSLFQQDSSPTTVFNSKLSLPTPPIQEPLF